jgi:hypothetical protein
MYMYIYIYIKVPGRAWEGTMYHEIRHIQHGDLYLCSNCELSLSLVLVTGHAQLCSAMFIHYYCSNYSLIGFAVYDITVKLH